MDKKKKKRVEKETGWEDGKDGVIEGLEQEEKDGGIGRKTEGGWKETEERSGEKDDRRRTRRRKMKQRYRGGMDNNNTKR